MNKSRLHNLNRAKVLETLRFIAWSGLWVTFVYMTSLYLTRGYINGKYADGGRQIIELKTKQDNLEKEIMDLKNELARISSYRYIEAEAQTQGFVPMDRFHYINVDTTQRSR